MEKDILISLDDLALYHEENKKLMESMGGMTEDTVQQLIDDSLEISISNDTTFEPLEEV